MTEIETNGFILTHYLILYNINMRHNAYLNM